MDERRAIMVMMAGVCATHYPDNLMDFVRDLNFWKGGGFVGGELWKIAQDARAAAPEMEKMLAKNRG